MYRIISLGSNPIQLSNPGAAVPLVCILMNKKEFCNVSYNPVTVRNIWADVRDHPNFHLQFDRCTSIHINLINPPALIQQETQGLIKLNELAGTSVRHTLITYI